jgi:hypothetical protein
MTDQERKKAIADLTLTYLNSYYPDWRLANVLANKKILENKYAFFEDIMPNLKQNGDSDGKKTIAQEIKHGIYYDTIAQCVQYVEDLFALFRATDKPDYFIKNIVTYDAGAITSRIKSFRKEQKVIEKLFWLPDSDSFSEEAKKIYQEGIDNLIKLTDDVVSFYKNYKFFYSQNKHGLTIPMRPFGNIFTDDQVIADQKGEMEPYLVAYDNFNLKAGVKRGTFTARHGLLMPGFTEAVVPHISALSEEDNFLRFVFPPDVPHFTFFTLEDHAKKVRCCLQIFISNYTQHVIASMGKPGVERTFQLPADYKANLVYQGTYTP